MFHTCREKQQPNHRKKIFLANVNYSLVSYEETTYVPELATILKYREW